MFLEGFEVLHELQTHAEGSCSLVGRTDSNEGPTEELQYLQVYKVQSIAFGGFIFSMPELSKDMEL